VCALLLALRPAVVSFHFGLPRRPSWPRCGRPASSPWPRPPARQEARQIEAAGVDAIVAQGIEAGGHGVFDPAGPTSA
jgi:nitronate monooxygenase